MIVNVMCAGLTIDSKSYCSRYFTFAINLQLSVKKISSAFVPAEVCSQKKNLGSFKGTWSFSSDNPSVCLHLQPVENRKITKAKDRLEITL